MTLGPKTRSILLAIALLLGATWLLAFGLLHGWYPEVQRWLIVEALDRGIGVEAELASAEGSLIGGLELKGLVIKPRRSETDPASPDPSDIPFVVDLVEVSVDISRAFEERLVVVNSLVLDGISLRLQQDETGQWQLLGLSTPSEAQGPAEVESDTPAGAWRLEFEDVAVRNANLTARWYDLQGPGYLIANGVLTTRNLSWPSTSDNLLPSVLAADFRMREGEFGPLQLSSGRLRVNGSQHRMQVRLERASARDPALGRFLLAAQATVDIEESIPSLSAFDAQLAFSRLDLEALGTAANSALELPTTTLNGEVRIHLADPASQLAKVDITLDPSEIEHRAFDSATAQLEYAIATQRWSFSELLVKSQISAFSGSGSGVRDNIESLDVDASNLPIAGLAEALDIETPLDGRVDLSARLSGLADDPVGTVIVEGEVIVDGRAPLDVAIDVRAKGKRSYEITRFDFEMDEPTRARFESDGPAQLVKSGDAWTLSNLKLEGSSGDIDIKTAVIDDTSSSIDFDAKGLDLRVMARYLDPALDIAGTLTGPATVRFAGGRVHLDANTTWRSPRLAALSAEEIVFEATTKEGLIYIDGSIDWGASSSLELAATLPDNALDAGILAMTSVPGFTLNLGLENLPASDLEFLLPQEQDAAQSLAGSLTGTLRARGTAEGPEADCSAVWIDARLGAAVADDVHLSCRTEGRTLLVEMGISDQARNGFVANASIEIDPLLDDTRSLLLNPNNHANLKAQDIDLAWLIPRSTARRLGRIKRVTGLATGELKLSGHPRGPRVNGELNIDNAKLQLALVDEKIGPIAGRLIFTNDEVRAERVEISSNKGPAVVEGSYRFGSQGQDELDARARFKNFALTHFPLLDARVDGDLDLTGSLSAIDAEGALVFSRVEVSLPTPEDPLLREVRILGLEGDDAEAQDPLGNAAPSAYQTMRANIDIDVRPGAKIKERGVDVVAEGQFRLRKKPMSPTLLQGNLQTTGGTYTFLGRTFDVTHGTATFEERIPPDPELELSASRRVGDVTVGIELTGRWSDRQSRLTSVPEMDENAILSYLVFDKPISEIGQRDDEQLNAVAAQLAGNLALSQLTQAISDQLPINEISVDVGEDLSVSSVGVETNVGDDIILRYDRSLQTGVGDRLTVEWKFYKGFSLRSEYANGDTSGLDLFWSFEY